MVLESVQTGRGQHTGDGGASSGTGWIEEEGGCGHLARASICISMLSTDCCYTDEASSQRPNRIIALLAGMHVGCRL